MFAHLLIISEKLSIRYNMVLVEKYKGMTVLKKPYIPRCPNGMQVLNALLRLKEENKPSSNDFDTEIFICTTSVP